MRTLELPAASPREQGRAHGEAFRPLIAEIAAIRLSLCAELGKFRSEAEVRELARRHLPVLEDFDRDLFAEIVGISEGAEIDPADVVVLNHYTDLRDLGPATSIEEDCSAVYARTDEGVLVGQTWDMHGSASAYVAMLKVPARGDGPAAWTFTITGCLGMTGVNGAGVSVAINNLTSTDARVGVVWPALVRRALLERTAEGARDVILGARVASGHHYLVASDWAAYGIETSGTRTKVVFSGEARGYVHTNHCLDPDVGERSVVRPESTTRERYAALCDAVARGAPRDRDELWRMLGSHDGYPRSVCTHLATPERPHATSTCGAIVMSLRKPEAWAAAGCIHRSRHQVFGF